MKGGKITREGVGSVCRYRCVGCVGYIQKLVALLCLCSCSCSSILFVF